MPTPRLAPRHATGLARRAGGRAEDGSVSLELVIVFPVLLLVVTGLLQYGLWFHARTWAQAAASEAVATARAHGATLDAGRARGESFLADHAADTVLDPTVTVTAPTPGHVAAQVHGRALSLLPFVPGPTVVQSAQGPVERFTTAGDP